MSSPKYRASHLTDPTAIVVAVALCASQSDAITPLRASDGIVTKKDVANESKDLIDCSKEHQREESSCARGLTKM